MSDEPVIRRINPNSVNKEAFHNDLGQFLEAANTVLETVKPIVETLLPVAGAAAAVEASKNNDKNDKK